MLKIIEKMWKMMLILIFAVMVDSDGDGVFESTFTAGNELTGDEFIAKTTPFKIYLPLVLSNK